jgi:antirestriction protein
MTLKEKINSIDYSKIAKPETIKQFIAKVEEKAKTSMTEAQALMDGVMLKIQEKYPDAIVKKIAPEKARAVITKLKKLKNIVPRKADYNKIADQIQSQQPQFTRQQAEELAKLRIEAQIARSTSFNDMIDVLSKSSFYSGRLSTADIDKGRRRDLQKDSNRGSITEADELKMRKKGVAPRKYKRISKAGHKNQYGTTQGGNVYYEYRDNRRDVDSKIRLEKGGMAEQGRFKKRFNNGGGVENFKYERGQKFEDQYGEIILLDKYSDTLWEARRWSGMRHVGDVVISEKDLDLIRTKKMAQGDLVHGRFQKHFKKGGSTQKYSYIPQKNIKALTTTYGNTIKGKDLLDGAYTTRKDIRQDPKMVRTIFEEEYFEEFGKGGLTKQQKDYLRKLGISEAEIKEADKREKAGRMSAINPKAPVTYYEGKLYENGGGVDKFALGDVISSDDTPKVWVGEWSLYNEGRLIGEWVDLSNFDSGAEVMAYIQSLLDKWTKETGELREEYAIFDYENFPSNLYSEGMGEGSFDKVIRAYKFSVENDVPMEVVGEIISEYDIDDLEEWFSERYAGQFDSDTDLAYWYVDEMLGGVENLDKRTQEMYFDYEAFGRDLAINDYRDINGYYFQTYRKGGMTMKNLNRYYKTK